jgi:hypothetical protein
VLTSPRALLNELSRLRVPFRASFATGGPSAHAAIDSVAAQWASRLPLNVRAGTAELFDDPRMQWGFERLGGLNGRPVRELGGDRGRR